MSENDYLEKTTIVSGDTVVSQFKKIREVPPALVVIFGPTALIGKQFLLTKPEYIIGRSNECDIFIDERSVSRNHARLIVSFLGQVTLSDLGSANKTFVASTQLQPNLPFELKNNDQIKCGNVILKYLEKGNPESVATQTMSDMALKDVLTGAYTKRALLDRGPEVIKRAIQLEEPISLLVFDLDHFKKVNDLFGHPGGDYVLKEFGRIVLNKVVRSEDFFARYGGEEFVLILLNSNLVIGSEVAERLRKTIEMHTFNYNNQIIPVTISIGVAERKATETDWDKVFNRADQAAYTSKKSGRNCVTVAS